MAASRPQPRSTDGGSLGRTRFARPGVQHSGVATRDRASAVAVRAGVLAVVGAALAYLIAGMLLGLQGWPLVIMIGASVLIATLGAALD